MSDELDKLHTSSFLDWRRSMFGRRPDYPNRPTPDEARGRIFDEWREELYNGRPSGSREWNGQDWQEYARLLFDDAYVVARGDGRASK